MLTRTDRDNRTQLVEPLTPRDHHLASAFLGLAIVLLVVFAAYRAGQIEVSVPVQGVEETDQVRSYE